MRDCDDLVSNPSRGSSFSEVLEINLRRRRLMQSGLGAAAIAFLGVPLGLAEREETSRPAISFKAVPLAWDDLVHVPEGYVAQVLYAWGDPVSDGPPFAPDAEQQRHRSGAAGGDASRWHALFPAAGCGRRAQPRACWWSTTSTPTMGCCIRMGCKPGMPTKCASARLPTACRSSRSGSGEDGQWEVVRPSHYGRRITAFTPMRMSGPAAGHPLMRTDADPDGHARRSERSTIAPMARPHGARISPARRTSTRYFVNPGTIPAEQRRYGVSEKGWGYRWAEHDPRFDAQAHPNELNRFGWVVEIDPSDPRSTPVKRTALGRFSHEGAVHRLARDRRVAIYSGDDQRNEHIYKFVTQEAYDPASAGAQPRSAGQRHAVRCEVP